MLLHALRPVLNTVIYTQAFNTERKTIIKAKI